MKILLINPPMLVNMPPLFMSFGMAYIAQELRKNGHEIELLDIDGYRFPKSEVSRSIEKSKADIIAIGGLVTVYPYLHWLIPEIRRLKGDIEIILGGAVASSLRQKCFEKFSINYEVIGEGEVTIIELLKELQRGKDLMTVKGIAFRHNGGIVFTENRPLMPSLENVPIIDDTLFPIEVLLKNSGGGLQIHTQRGCPSSCTFCFNCFRIVSSKIRYRPVGNVLDEVQLFKDKYGSKIKLFNMSAECLTLDKKWVIEFCKEILNRNLRFKYRVTSRVDTIDEERLEWLKKSGCEIISFGLETGSDKVMKYIKKGVSIEQGKKAVYLAKKYIPNIEATIILGYVGENKNTLKETVEFCKDLGVAPAIFKAVPFPGTELYKMALETGCIKNEEEYMMGLDNMTISMWIGKDSDLQPRLNLTEMPDDVAQAEVEAAKNEIERYYFYKKFGFNVFKDILLNIYVNIKKNGIKITLIKILKAIKKYL